MLEMIVKLIGEDIAELAYHLTSVDTMRLFVQVMTESDPQN